MSLKAISKAMTRSEESIQARAKAGRDEGKQAALLFDTLEAHIRHSSSHRGAGTRAYSFILVLNVSHA